MYHALLDRETPAADEASVEAHRELAARGGERGQDVLVRRGPSEPHTLSGDHDHAILADPAHPAHPTAGEWQAKLPLTVAEVIEAEPFRERADLTVEGGTEHRGEARAVTTEKSLLELFRPPVALAKIYVHPNLQFSADGRRAFVAPMAADIPHHWRRGVVAIDVPSATIAWRALSGDDVRGIHLSPDGARLYVLVSEQKEALTPEARLLVLDASSGAVLGQTETLPRPAFQIVTVARP